MFFRKRKNDSPSHQALDDAQRHVMEVRLRHLEVVTIAGALREARKKNHFADQIAILFSGRV